ncbi:MAG: hypothetical protein KHX75_13800, partial [Lachnospiraceae bacterium]|nr:hypothetical protein [Lachnospiraceae bacterium]
KLRKVYDEKNRVKGYTYQKDRVGHEVEFLYGDVEKQQKPGLGYGIEINGAQKIAYEYDALGRVIRTHNHFSDTNTSTQEYTYVSGKEAGVTTNLVASVREGNRAESYAYDACGNVETMVERSADGSERKIRYYYDALNQLVREDNQNQNKTICYTYDVGGNMVRRDEYSYTENPVITEAPWKSDTFEYQTGGWRDQLRFYNGQAITYDAMGNPLQYLGMQMEWEKGHQLRHITGAGLDMYCMYNDSGKRIRKTVNGVTTDFYLDGSAILMQTSSDGSRIDFFYDDKGNVFAMKYQNEMYFYRKNLFGDILGILDSHGTELVKYEYNSWGKLLNLTDYSSNGLGRKNPFRFKGYYYDEELGMYYLNSRYYDPETGRFVSADDVEVLKTTPTALTDKNLYSYCDNNPIGRKDGTGAVWETVFDVVSLGFSIAEVAANPYDPSAWAGVVGDAIDLIPIVTGVGEAVRALRFTDKMGNTLEIAEAVDFTKDARDIIKSLEHTNGFTKSTRSAGRKIHNGYKAGPSFREDYKEYRKVKGIRPDYYNPKTKTIYELKPYNPRSAKAGVKQLKKYKKKIGKRSNVRLEFY